MKPLPPSVKHALDRMTKALATYQPPSKKKAGKKAHKEEGE